MKRILVADDHAMARKGLQKTLGEKLDSVTFGEAENGPQVVEQVNRHEWDLVLLGLNLQGRSSLDTLAEIRKARPNLPVLALGDSPLNESGVRALRMGASGYINQQSATAELVAAVQSLLAGGRYISSALAGELAAELRRENEGPVHRTLSNRESQVMLLIATGKSLKEIAAELSISVKTVGTYHTRILAKMRMKNDIEITRYAILNQLVN